jgi:hypothetical protein
MSTWRCSCTIDDQPTHPHSLLHAAHLLWFAVQVWLQDFAWTEREHGEKLGERRVQRGCGTQLRSASMFCFETAIRMFYWSTLVR